MSEDIKRIVVGLLVFLIFGYGALRVPLSASSEPHKLYQEFYKARQLFLEGNYLDSLLKLAVLEKQVQEDKAIDNKNELLAEINFLSGICFMDGWNQADRGKDSFKKALEHNPAFRVNEELYGQKAAQIFTELMDTELKDVSEEKPMTEKLEDCFIRITKKNAMLRIKPDNAGVILKKLPLGALLEVEEEMDEWLKIKLPPDKDGFVLTGFIQRSYTEVSSMIH
jgi:hypothetical protein